MYAWSAPPVSKFLSHGNSLRCRRELTISNCSTILWYENFKFCRMIVVNLLIRGKRVFRFRSYIFRVARRMKWIRKPCEVSKNCCLLMHGSLHVCVHIVFDWSKVIGWLVGSGWEGQFAAFLGFWLSVFGSACRCDDDGENDKGCHFGDILWRWIWAAKLETEVTNHEDQKLLLNLNVFYIYTTGTINHCFPSLPMLMPRATIAMGRCALVNVFFVTIS